MDNKEIGKFIKKLRIEKGYSQEELAKKVYVTRQAVSQWERGRTTPDYATIIELSKTFKIEIADIYAGKIVKKEEKDKIYGKVIEHIEKKGKRRFKTLITIIVILAVIFLGYYFINSYKSLKVYSLSYEQKGFEANGLLIISKKDSYLKFDVYDLEVKSLKLYIKEKNEEKEIASNDDNFIYLQQRNGYDEYLTYNNIDQKINNLYIRIELKNNEVYDEKLTTIKQFENDNLLFYIKQEIVNGENDIDAATYEIPSKIRKEFKYKDGVYSLEKQEKDKKINIYYSKENNTLTITEKIKNIEKNYNYNIEFKNLYYIEIENNNKELKKIEVNINEVQEPEKKEIVDYFIKNYKEVYLDEKE